MVVVLLVYVATLVVVLIDSDNGNDFKMEGGQDAQT